MMEVISRDDLALIKSVPLQMNGQLGTGKEGKGRAPLSHHHPHPPPHPNHDDDAIIAILVQNSLYTV
jgi:hypothetical protein